MLINYPIRFSLLLCVLFFGQTLLAQIRLDVEGDAKIRGKIDITASATDLTSLFVGKDAGLNDDGTSNNNTFIGVDAGRSNNVGNWNTAIGHQALYSNTTGYRNTANGNQALYSNTIGFLNTANGFQALYSNTMGAANTAYGLGALFSNTDGDNNTANGYWALYSNSTGNSNTANGFFALYSNTTGYQNTANGYRALHSNSTGNNNTANGTAALYSNTDRSNLIAIGDSALYNNGVGATQSFHATANVAVGSKALFSNTTGYLNTANGYQALYSNTTGGANTANGYQALYFNTTGVANTANGLQALYSNTYGSDNTANGRRALYSNTTGFRNTANGYLALLSNTSGNSNTANGYQADVSSGTLTYASAFGASAISNASYKTVIGASNQTVIGGYAAWSILSDGRFKENIGEDVPGMDFIRLLRPVTYAIDLDKLQRHITAQMPDTLAARYLPTAEEQARAKAEIRTGFIAQEVEAAAQKIEYDFDGVNAPTNPTDNYSIAYSQFVPSLVKATQEQEVEIRDQRSEIRNQRSEIRGLKSEIERLRSEIRDQKAEFDALQEMVQQLLGNQSEEEAPVILNQGPSLEQNQPNPVNGTTRINYFLPQSKTGELLITAIDGKELQRIPLAQNGSGQVDLRTGNFPAGTYHYSLIVNGQVVATKRMVIQK